MMAGSALQRITTFLVAWMVALITFPMGSFAQDAENLPSWFQRGSYVEDNISYVMLKTEGFYSAAAAKKAIGDTAYEHVLNHFALQVSEAPTEELASTLGINRTRVLNELVSDEFQFVGEVSEKISDQVIDRSYRAYFRLELDPEFIQTAEEQFKDEITRKRLVSTGVAGGGVLSLLAILFGYLRLNHATRGFYSRRLQMGAGALAVLIGLLCYALVVAFS